MGDMQATYSKDHACREDQTEGEDLYSDVYP